MPTNDVSPFRPVNDAPAETTAALADRLSRLVVTARALILGGRVVDLAGLDDRIGLLTARMLDMEWEESRRLLPQIHAIIAEIDGLSATLRSTRGPPEI